MIETKFVPTAFIGIQTFMTINKMTVVPHTSYSPDLDPCDLFLFPRMKINLQGGKFETIEDIHAEWY